jgi:hypothetical protein
MFTMTALVAVAAYMAKVGVVAPDLLCLLAVPVLIGAAVGVLAGRVKAWIVNGLKADVVLLGLLFLDRFIRQ